MFEKSSVNSNAVFKTLMEIPSAIPDDKLVEFFHFVGELSRMIKKSKQIGMLDVAVSLSIRILRNTHPSKEFVAAAQEAVTKKKFDVDDFKQMKFSGII